MSTSRHDSEDDPLERPLLGAGSSNGTRLQPIVNGGSHSRSSSNSKRSHSRPGSSSGRKSFEAVSVVGAEDREDDEDFVVHDGRSMPMGKLSERDKFARGYELDEEGGRGRDDEEGYPHGATSPLLQPDLRHSPTPHPDPFLHPKLNSTKSTLSSAIFNMSNSILGAGIIGLPFAISEAGFFTGLFLLVTLCGITDWTIRLIVVDAKMSGRETYIGIMEFCFGWWGRVGVSFFQFAFALGGMCANGVIIGDTIPSVIRYIFPSILQSGVHPHLALFANRRFVILLATLFVSYPLSLNKDIAKLSKASGMALVSMFIIVASVVVRGPLVDDSLRGSTDGMFSIIEPKVFEAIGVMSFAFVCHHNSLLIYGSLHTPTLDRFNAVTHASTGMSLICCVVMSMAGYLSFRDKTQGNILNNFPADDLMINIARLCFGLNMFTTTPLEAFVCREVVEELFFEGRAFSWRRHIIITTGLVAFAMSVAMVTCDLGIVLEITGGLSASALAYVFPAMAYCKLTNGPWYSRQKLPASLCAAFGMVVLVLSLLIALRKMATGEGHSSKVCL